MPRRARWCAILIAGAALGCAGEPADRRVDAGGASDADARVCEGDRWASDDTMLAAIADCTTITGNLALTGNALVRIELPVLRRVDGNFSVWSNPALVHVSVPMLASAGGWVDVSNNAALTSLELPALESVNERAITAVYDLAIRDNALPTCQAHAIRDRLLANGFDGSIDISGNRGTCPP